MRIERLESRDMLAAPGDYVAYWPLDEGSGPTAFDQSANDNDGTLNGATWTTGKVGSGALSFDGSNDFVEIANDPSLEIEGNSITLAAWIRPHDGGQNWGSRVFSKRTDSGGSDVYALYTQNNRVRFRLDGLDLYSSATFTANEWLHVVATYDGTQKRLYFNGTEDSTQGKTDNINASSRAAHIGTREDEGTNRFFNGEMDDLLIYDRALTPAEITSLCDCEPVPTVSFTDISTASGVNLPSDGGHGVAWADVDGDGDSDLYVTNLLQNTGQRRDYFFQNDGDGTFTEQAVELGIDDLDGGSHGLTWSDLDNDGDYDLVNGSTWGSQGTFGDPIHLVAYRQNDCGEFDDATPMSITTGEAIETRGTTTVDIDGDGDLDIVEIPGAQAPGTNKVWRNEGNFQFTDVSAGVLSTIPFDQGILDTDYDGDGDVDILGGGYLSLAQNDGTGAFVEVPLSSIGISGISASDGITSGDVNGDGHFDLLFVDAVGDDADLFLNDGDGTFSPGQQWSGVDGYMGGFADLDNDGDLDLIFAGDDIAWLNDGNGTFASGPSTQATATDPRAIAFADFDNDGDMDFAVASKGSATQLIRNDFDSGNWLRVELVSPNGQAGAFGAKVRLFEPGTSNLIAIREAHGNHGYLGQDDPRLHFGTGTHVSVDIEVTWLDGSTTVLNASSNQTVNIAG